MNSLIIPLVLFFAVMDLGAAAYFWRLLSAEKMPALLAKFAALAPEERRKKLQVLTLSFLMASMGMLVIAIWLWLRSKA
jgi:hypothetical protein